jgi:hypothetical protein
LQDAHEIQDLLEIVRAWAVTRADLRAVALVGSHARVIRTQQWGRLTERRLITAEGLELDVGVVTPDWAATDPVDEGTRRVVADGMVALYDPDGLLAAL